jgi:hypothetical protein
VKAGSQEVHYEVSNLSWSGPRKKKPKFSPELQDLLEQEEKAKETEEASQKMLPISPGWLLYVSHIAHSIIMMYWCNIRSNHQPSGHMLDLVKDLNSRTR